MRDWLAAGKELVGLMGDWLGTGQGLVRAWLETSEGLVRNWSGAG